MSPVALVTGASSGFGELTCRRLNALGWEVYGVARRTDRLAELAALGVHTFAMDVTDDASMTAGVERILAEQGRIDALVNNAGYGSYGAVEDVPLDEARRQYEVNVFGAARLIQLVTPSMRQQGRGRIINITSIAAEIYQPLAGWYHSTKAGLELLSDCLRIELKPFGIDVVMVEPGPVETEWTEIAHASLIERSAGTAYAEQARSVEKVLNAMVKPPFTVSPDTVAATIVKSLTAPKPKPRYPVGVVAATVMNFRRIAPDRLVDAITRLATSR
ncbi:oxidoreductase [Enemella sp. A6]|uniref:oxidoreductase n=1 Tax=Enemella sp. A6 TaxID=3440152 RepID=UPI003EB90743